MFLQRAQESARLYLRLPRSLHLAEGRSAAWLALDAVLVDAAESGLELHLVIYPFHAQLLTLFEDTGLWPSFERWKADLVSVLDAATRARPGAPVILWDFSGYHGYATERVPAPGDRSTELRWYWEAGHFKKELGDILLSKMLASKREQDFGIGMHLNPESIDAQLAATRLQSTRYRSQERRAVADIARLVSALRAGTSAVDSGLNDREHGS